MVVLGFDGLEYSLVEEWGELSNLRLDAHGYYVLPREYYHEREGVPFTPLIWPSMITGLSPGAHGLREWWTYGRVLDALRRVPPLRWIRGKRRLLGRLGLRPRVVDRRALRIRTVFEIVRPSVALFVPGYNEPTHFHLRLNESLGRGVDSYISTIWSIHEERKEALWMAAGGEWRLLMAWFDIADLLGHVCWHRCRDMLRRAYRDLDDLVGRLRARISDAYFLVISDHGMQDSGDGVTGNHSDHGYWAISPDDGWRPRKPTDVFFKILEVTGTEDT